MKCAGIVPENNSALSNIFYMADCVFTGFFITNIFRFPHNPLNNFQYYYFSK